MISVTITEPLHRLRHTHSLSTASDLGSLTTQLSVTQPPVKEAHCATSKINTDPSLHTSSKNKKCFACTQAEKGKMSGTQISSVLQEKVDPKMLYLAKLLLTYLGRSVY